MHVEKGKIVNLRGQPIIPVWYVLIWALVVQKVPVEEDMDGWEVKVYILFDRIFITQCPSPSSSQATSSSIWFLWQGGVQQELLKDQLLQWTHTGGDLDHFTHCCLAVSNNLKWLNQTLCRLTLATNFWSLTKPGAVKVFEIYFDLNMRQNTFCPNFLLQSKHGS